jgi:beta-N-acetylhexosaminidase
MSTDQHLMLSFDGTSLPGWLEESIAASPPAGLTLFRELNMESPHQLAGLVEKLQGLNRNEPPLLIAVDQEGGQLQGLIGSTPFAGNMALGAAGDLSLTARVAAAMGAEMRAVGVNLNYAPVADVATRPGNPSLGVRSFGEDPTSVAAHVSAAVEGFRSAGVLATLKHFPGKGEAVVDPHYELPRMDLDIDRLRRVELLPFEAGVAAGADLIMTGHYGVPALTGSEETPVSMSEQAIDGFIRREMGFDGVVITDALDMGALDQGAGQIVDIIASMRGGTDLLLVMPEDDLTERARLALARGSSRGLIPQSTLDVSTRRITAARRRLPSADLKPEMVGRNRDLADELARRSITLVRNDAGLIPLDAHEVDRILVLEPEPTNVTPADTTASHSPALAEALRQVHGHVTGIVYRHDPEPSDIAGLVEEADGYGLVVVGTVNGTAGQAALVNELIKTEARLATVAMREPQDLSSYPRAQTHLCTYSSHPPSLLALAQAMFGQREFVGRLPVSIPGLYPLGHGV